MLFCSGVRPAQHTTPQSVLFLLKECLWQGAECEKLKPFQWKFHINCWKRSEISASLLYLINISSSHIACFMAVMGKVSQGMWQSDSLLKYQAIITFLLSNAIVTTPLLSARRFVRLFYQSDFLTVYYRNKIKFVMARCIKIFRVPYLHLFLYVWRRSYKGNKTSFKKLTGSSSVETEEIHNKIRPTA